MPFYNASPFAAAVKLLYAGVAEYFFGSWPQNVSPTQLYVTSVGLAANTATFGVTVYGGNVPLAGSLLTVRGTATAGGFFNVVNAALTAVSLNNAGVGTVSVALTGAGVAATPDAGIAVVPQPEVPETLANGASVPVSMSNDSWGGDLNSVVSVSASFPVLPTAVTVQLQAANFNQDAQFSTIGTVATVAGGAITANGLTMYGTYLFYRVLVSGVSGVGSITVKIEA